MVAALIGVAAAAVCGLAEWLHLRRTRRVAYLAFGPVGLPAPWTRFVPALRSAAVGALVWGLAVLFQLDSGGLSFAARTKDDDRFAHLVLALDVSPSMDLTDAGPGGNLRRADRARAVLKSMLERLDLRQTRVSIIAFFSAARPVVVDTFDPEVVANILEDLPLEQAFSAGKTEMYAAVDAAEQIGRAWPADSATLVLVSDGDTLPPKKPVPLPSAYGEVLILGIGDPHRGQFIDGHVSRQDASSLQQLALRLGGEYIDANARQIATSRLADLPTIGPDGDRNPWNRRETAVAAVIVATTCLALVAPLLALFGGAWNAAGAGPHLGYTFRHATNSTTT